MGGAGNLFAEVYRGTRALVTGHTGFKGSWLSLWLAESGAEVLGYALEPPTEPSLFVDAQLDGVVQHVIGDVRDAGHSAQVVADFQPEIVFHLAAQSLVRAGYESPTETFDTNIMGTVNVLEACRRCDSVRAVVNVTSDKCYENRETGQAYREDDPLGGYDPYSASKGCAEIVTSSYARSFFSESGSAAVASARAGNVIGGGDWAADRLVPDCIRALVSERAIEVRNPGATRPWQHVLEPLSGYLLLGARLLADSDRFVGGWNFGPDPSGELAVGDVVAAVVRAWGAGEWRATGEAGPHEAGRLQLDISKAREQLGWEPVLDVDDAVEMTVAWYRAWADDPARAREYMLGDIARYARGAGEAGAVWAAPQSGEAQDV